MAKTRGWRTRSDASAHHGGQTQLGEGDDGGTRRMAWPVTAKMWQSDEIAVLPWGLANPIQWRRIEISFGGDISLAVRGARQPVPANVESG